MSKITECDIFRVWIGMGKNIEPLLKTALVHRLESLTDDERAELVSSMREDSFKSTIESGILDTLLFL